MAQGPDPNRNFDTDPEAARGGLGDSQATRFGLPSWAIALIVVVLVAAVIVMMARSQYY